MNKTHSPLLFIVIAVTLAVSLPAMGRGTASPYLKTLMAHNGAGAQAPVPGAATQAGRTVSPLYTSIVIETESPDTPLPDFVTELARRGELAVVSVPQSRLNDLLGAPGVLRMESGVCNTPTMTQARSMCGLEKAYQIPGHFRGRNVVVGFTDIGFDPGHINFTDPATGHSRVKRLVNYTITSPLPGRLTSENEISAWTTDTDQEWHATHVAGILAGSYAKNNYYGVAPEAEIVATTSLLADGYLLAGCEEIIAYAKEQQKPAVINMSIASSTGSHDGTSLFNRYMERLADDAVVCISSGNSGDKWSAHIPFTATAEKPRIQTAFREYPHSSPFAVSGIADLWSLDDAAFTVTLLVYDSQTRQIAARIPTVDPSAGIDFKVLATTALAPNYNTEPDPTLSAMFASAAVLVSCELNPANNRFNTVVSFIWRNKTEANLTHGRYWLGIEVGANPGNGVELYASNDIEFMRLGGEFQPEFSVAKSINDLACGHGIVSVGAVSERNMW
ncbi:MAG: S8 family serine peptidase, partial [Muribaculaceae bacterium]|nr:S8 family serine peptidase [Muribaculaceae bacterium]